MYGGIVLSGSALFFASQQAFGPSFGVFVMGFVVALLAFLIVAFLEDGTRGAKVHWIHHRPARPAMMPYWIGVACAVFILAGAAFWLMPRGELNLVGPPQVTVVPYAGASLGEGAAPTEASLAEITRLLNPEDGDEQFPSGSSMAGFEPGDGVASGSPDGPIEAGSGPGRADGEGAGSGQLQPNVFGAGPESDISDDAVFFVRSKVSSYWQGRSLERFDGRI